MKTARRFTGDGVEINIELGKEYQVVHGMRSPERFKEIWQEQYAEELPENDTVESFIIGFLPKQERIVIPVYSTDVYYIMSENGQTFSKVKSR